MNNPGTSQPVSAAANQAGRAPALREGTDVQRLEHAVDRLAASILEDPRTHHISAAFLPDREAVLRILEKLTWLMFPGFFGPRELSEANVRGHVANVMADVSGELQAQVSAALRYERRITPAPENRAPGNRAPAPAPGAGTRLPESPSSGSTSAAAPGRRAFDRACAETDARAQEIVLAFLARLPEARIKLSLDVQAAHDGDPAATHTDEVIFSYPGVRALSIHRLAHELYRLDVPLIPRIMSEHVHSTTGIDIHPGARIGKSMFIDHGTGVVIGETSIIGDHCRIYQGVTLGAKHFEKDEKGRLKRGVKRHPTLEDHVTVFAGATILGGDTVIGAGSVVNGGVFLTQSVPPGHIVRGPKADITLRNNPDLPPPMYNI